MPLTVEIQIESPVFSKIVNHAGILLLKSCLSYEAVFWRSNKYGKERSVYQKSLLDKKGRFPTGLLFDVVKYCDEKNINIDIDDSIYNNYSIKVVDPKLPGIIFRKDQLHLLSRASEEMRGVIVSPTGSGKTVLAAGVISCFPEAKTLFLCHTVDLVNQAKAEFEKYGFECSLFAHGVKDLSGKVVVATRQTLSKVSPEEYTDIFDMVIVDEVHHLSGEDTEYYSILSNLPCPLRFGFTATMPKDLKPKLAITAMLGPVIGEVSINEGSKAKFLAKVKIKILRAPFDYAIRELKTYKDVYNKGVVNNEGANKVIADFVKSELRLGRTTLVMVTQTDHGRNLNVLIPGSYFLYGETEGAIRDSIKEKFKNKKVGCVIASTIWKEGVNIPSLDTVVNASGGKDEKGVMQVVGRGLRITNDKDEVLIVDIFNPSHPYLVSHFGERISLYCENNWI